MAEPRPIASGGDDTHGEYVGPRRTHITERFPVESPVGCFTVCVSGVIQ